MREELDKALCEKYPKIFRDRHANMRVTAMCWGFDCGDGWYNIIDELCEKLQKLCDENGYQVVATQVKEKFATLRFYTDMGNEEVYKVISEAEGKSEVTCEECGAPGEVYDGGWLRTLCPEHAEKRGYTLTLRETREIEDEEDRRLETKGS